MVGFVSSSIVGHVLLQGANQMLIRNYTDSVCELLKLLLPWFISVLLRTDHGLFKLTSLSSYS